MRRFLFCFVFIFVHSVAQGRSCNDVIFTHPNLVSLDPDVPTLIVTHPSTQWDGRLVSKPGLESAVKFAKKNSYKIIYLRQEDPQLANTYFFGDCKPDYWIASKDGEAEFRIPTRKVIAVGGHWEQCQNLTINHILKKWADEPVVKRELVLVADGIYTSGVLVNREDSFYSDYQKFLRTLGFGTQRPSRIFLKTSLIEMLGIVGSFENQKKFIERMIYDLSPLKNKYRVELFLAHQRVKNLTPKADPKAPLLKIHYVYSLYDGGFTEDQP